MKTNVTPSMKPFFFPVATVLKLVTGGAAGWVDTDCSASLGTDQSKLWVGTSFGSAHQNAGARAHGESTDNKADCNNTMPFFTYASASGHVDLYREAADMTYEFVGYIR